jgi:hypothetical protein
VPETQFVEHERVGLTMMLAQNLPVQSLANFAIPHEAPGATVDAGRPP